MHHAVQYMILNWNEILYLFNLRPSLQVGLWKSYIRIGVEKDVQTYLRIRI